MLIDAVSCISKKDLLPIKDQWALSIRILLVWFPACLFALLNFSLELSEGTAYQSLIYNLLSEKVHLSAPPWLLSVWFTLCYDFSALFYNFRSSWQKLALTVRRLSCCCNIRHSWSCGPHFTHTTSFMHFVFAEIWVTTSCKWLEEKPWKAPLCWRICERLCQSLLQFVLNETTSSLSGIC